MSSIYRPNTNQLDPGPLTVIPQNELVRDTQKLYSGCEECSSIYETMNYRSDFDKLFVPIYQSRLSRFNTNLMDLKFAK